MGWKARDLTAVVVESGTGELHRPAGRARVCQGSVYATDCEFFGVETFAAIAFRLASQAGQRRLSGDALQGKLFRRDYVRAGDETWCSASPLEIVPVSEWLATWSEDQWISGPATALVETRLPAGTKRASLEIREPRPLELLAVAQQAPWAVTKDVWRRSRYLSSRKLGGREGYGQVIQDRTGAGQGRPRTPERRVMRR